MAKKSIIERNKKRARIAEKYAAKRVALKKTIGDINTAMPQRMAAVAALQKLPRNASPTRRRNRCHLTGRANGYYRKFGLSRNKLREAAMRGDIPGLIMASW